MICPQCNGTGYCDLYMENECPMCDGTGEVEQTRFEFMQTCTIEEMAEVLSNISTDAWFAGLNDMDRPVVQKDNWQQWLKQPHRKG